MREGNNYRHNLVLNVVTVNLHVLSTLMKGGISSDEDSGLTIISHGH